MGSFKATDFKRVTITCLLNYFIPQICIKPFPPLFFFLNVINVILLKPQNRAFSCTNITSYSLARRSRLGRGQLAARAPEGTSLKC